MQGEQENLLIESNLTVNGSKEYREVLDGSDWHISVGSDERIVLHCLTLLFWKAKSNVTEGERMSLTGLNCNKH